MVAEANQTRSSLLQRAEQRVKLTTRPRIGPAYTASVVDAVSRLGITESVSGARPFIDIKTDRQISIPDFPPEWYMVARTSDDYRSAQVYQRISEDEEKTARKRTIGDISDGGIIVGLVMSRNLSEITNDRDAKMFDMNIFNDLMSESHNQSRPLEDLLNESKLTNLQVKELERKAIAL
jgi:hypothetical protein